MSQHHLHYDVPWRAGAVRLAAGIPYMCQQAREAMQGTAPALRQHFSCEATADASFMQTSTAYPGSTLQLSRPQADSKAWALTLSNGKVCMPAQHK